MKLGKTVQDALNEQLNQEFFADYLYLAMAVWFKANNFQGMAQWMLMQSDEEFAHGMKFLDYVHDREGRVTLKAIPQPPADFKSPLDAFQQALEHERKVSAMIQKHMDLAVKEKDYATQGFLQWFLVEQVEEEKVAATIVEQLRMVEGQGAGLLMMDRSLGERAKK